MELLSEPLELRGIKNTKGKNGKVYYMLYCESIKSGEPVQLYCGDSSALQDGLAKGDKIDVILYYNQKYKSLVVKQVNRAN